MQGVTDERLVHEAHDDGDEEQEEGQDLTGLHEHHQLGRAARRRLLAPGVVRHLKHGALHMTVLLYVHRSEVAY